MQRCTENSTAPITQGKQRHESNETAQTTSSGPGWPIRHQRVPGSDPGAGQHTLRGGGGTLAAAPPPLDSAHSRCCFFITILRTQSGWPDSLALLTLLLLLFLHACLVSAQLLPPCPCLLLCRTISLLHGFPHAMLPKFYPLVSRQTDSAFLYFYSRGGNSKT